VLVFSLTRVHKGVGVFIDYKSVEIKVQVVYFNFDVIK